ncbi:MAG: hypothetical protein HY738_16135 [Bacteroidia bacterium]|nr:hypothetical protein [Bacteroidia bacterium]
MIINLLSCESPEPFIVQGYKPVYASLSEARNIYSSEPEIMLNPGKIYIKGQYIYINEIAKGVHIIDNSAPENPIKTAFIHIPGNYDIAIRDNILYAGIGLRTSIFTERSHPSDSELRITPFWMSEYTGPSFSLGMKIGYLIRR